MAFPHFPKVSWDTPKVCRHCKIEKHRSEFRKQRQSANAVSAECKPCKRKLERERMQKWRDENPEESRLRSLKFTLKSVYGISLEQYEEMLSRQRGVCAICGEQQIPTGRRTKTRLSVDHCHVTGMVRGLLCGKCNSGIASFRENLVFLDNARAYLMASRSISNVRV